MKPDIYPEWMKLIEETDCSKFLPILKMNSFESEKISMADLDFTRFTPTCVGTEHKQTELQHGLNLAVSMTPNVLDDYNTVFAIAQWRKDQTHGIGIRISKYGKVELNQWTDDEVSGTHVELDAESNVIKSTLYLDGERKYLEIENHGDSG